MTAISLNKQIEAAATHHGLNPALVMAVCEKESGFDTYAVRYESHWRWFLDPRRWSLRVGTTTKTERILQSCSWGLMQIMGTVARENGFQQDFPRLCSPEVGLMYGCAHLSKLIKKHIVLTDALAAYNAGNPKSKVGRDYAFDVMGLMQKYL